MTEVHKLEIKDFIFTDSWCSMDVIVIANISKI